MKKIPTLFKREFENHKIVGIIDEITPGCEDAFKYGMATIKVDGACCAIFDGVFYKRYDCKKGKVPPEGAIPCCDPDPVTGHWPHWVKVDANDPADKWFIAALDRAIDMDVEFNDGVGLEEGTYEAIGLHFNGNPYNLNVDNLAKHGKRAIFVERTFDDIKKYLEKSDIEGIVFWLDGEPICKIKRTDFGFEWPIKKE